MEPLEWCAVAHVDISPRSSLELGESLLEQLAAAATSDPGTIGVSVLKQPIRTNHFEIIGRFASEAAYREHLAGTANLAFREGIAPMLGSPYEDRLHGPRGSVSWPSAALGDFVALTQFEVLPRALDEAEAIIEQLAQGQLRAPGLEGQALLQRRQRENNLELISVWASPEAFETHLAAAAPTRGALSPMLVAPVDDRRHQLLHGIFSTP